MAHNAVSMQSILTTLRAYHPKRLICMFGAGGNRPKVRRFEMGEVSGNLADLSVITADNSRYENVLDILADIKVGLAKTDANTLKFPTAAKPSAGALKTHNPATLLSSQARVTKIIRRLRVRNTRLTNVSSFGKSLIP